VARYSVQIFDKQSDWSKNYVIDAGTTALVLYCNSNTTGMGRRWHMIFYTCKQKTGIGWIPGIFEWDKL